MKMEMGPQLREGGGGGSWGGGVEYPGGLAPTPPPLCLDSLTLTHVTPVTLLWQAHPGSAYLVAYSADLRTWLSDLPNTNLPAPASQQSFQFTDAIISPRRFYRVRQTKVN